MRTTLDLNQELLDKAKKLTKITEKTALIHEALRVLIAKFAQLELANLAGVDRNIKAPPRRREKK